MTALSPRYGASPTETRTFHGGMKGPKQRIWQAESGALTASFDRQQRERNGGMIMMTDEELAQAGERLYASLLLTDLSVFEVGGLTAAIRTRTKWSELAPGLKVAVFRIVANAQQIDQVTGPIAPTATSSGPPASAEAPPGTATAPRRAAPDVGSDANADAASEAGHEQT